MFRFTYIASRRPVLRVVAASLFATLSVFAQAPGAGNTGQISGTVKDPAQALVTGSQVTLTNQQTKAKTTAVTDDQGAYTFAVFAARRLCGRGRCQRLQAATVSPELNVVAGQTVNFDFALTLAGNVTAVNVSAGTVENAYRVDNVAAGGPLGTTPILDLPYSVNVISRQLIDDTQSRNFKEAAKYLPLVSFQEMQGPEVLRPETRGMQGSNMQNDRKDGMGIAVTTPSALEEYEQVEVVEWTGRPFVWSREPVGHVQLRDQAPHRGTVRRDRTGLRGQHRRDRAYRCGRTLRQEKDVRVSREFTVGRRRRLCHRQPAPASVGRGCGRLRASRSIR